VRSERIGEGVSSVQGGLNPRKSDRPVSNQTVQFYLNRQNPPWNTQAFLEYSRVLKGFRTRIKN
jgi:hypothetical protein